MKILRGKIHKKLGMTIYYFSTDKGILSTVDYIEKMINDTPEDMKGVSEIPVTHHFFDISEDVTKISQTDSDLFHQFVAHLS